MSTARNIFNLWADQVRTLVPAIVLLSFGCSESSSIRNSDQADGAESFPLALVTNVHDSDRDGDGIIDRRIRTIHRGPQRNRIVIEHFEAKDGTNLMLQSRSLQVAGESPFTESDEDGDGFLETLILYSSDRRSMEVFRRDRSGSVTPVSSEELAGHLQANAAIATFFERGMNEDMDEEEVAELFDETREAVREADDMIRAAKSDGSDEISNDGSDIQDQK